METTKEQLADSSEPSVDGFIILIHLKVHVFMFSLVHYCTRVFTTSILLILKMPEFLFMSTLRTTKQVFVVLPNY